MKILSFGGGVQSTVLALMAIRNETERPDLVMFADTGDESQATYIHIEKVANALTAAGIEFCRVSRGNIRRDVLAAAFDKTAKTGRVGQPPFFVHGQTPTIGRLWRKCSREYKIDPMVREIRRRFGVAPKKKMPKGVTVEKWLGITVDEATRMKPSRHPWELVRWPLIDMGMTRWDCHRYLKAAGWGVVPKSSCLICPYHDNAYWRDLRDNAQEEWDGVVTFEKQLHKGRIPGTNSEAFLHRSCVPLAQVDLSTDTDRGQQSLSLWAGECEGICGT